MHYPLRAMIIADIESNAHTLIREVLQPAGIEGSVADDLSPPADVLVVDLSQLVGDPLSGLRERRKKGDQSPAILLAAHVPNSRLRDLFRLGVRDIVFKPYRADEVSQAIEDTYRNMGGQAGQRAEARERAKQEEARLSLGEMRLLTEIGRAVAGLEDLDEILARVVEAAAYVTGAEEANIYLAEPETEEVVLRASKPAGERRATLQRLRITDTIAGKVYRTGKPVMFQPALKRGKVKVQTGFLVQSLIKTPVRVGKEVVGVLGVYNYAEPRRFEKRHLGLLQALADWAGVALERAVLLQGLADSPERNRQLTVAPQEWVGEINALLESLDAAIQTSPDPLPDAHVAKLRQIKSQLENLGSVPMAVLDSDQRKELVDLPRLLREVAKAVGSDYPERDVQVRDEPPSRIPLFPGDESRIRMIVNSLVGRALERAERGPVILAARRVEVREGRWQGVDAPQHVHVTDGLWAVVQITDPGPGLSPSDVWALSGPLAEPSAGAMGRGLSLGEIRLILQSMGGVIWHHQGESVTRISIALPMS
jgi:DNA-binding response OmpR family regulator